MPSSEWPDLPGLEAAVRAVREKLPPGAQFGPQLNALDAIEFCQIALTAAAKASPVIPAAEFAASNARWNERVERAVALIPTPKCETCDGQGHVGMREDRVGHETGRDTACPDCHGTGVADVIPVAVLREFARFMVESWDDEFPGHPFTVDPESSRLAIAADIADLIAANRYTDAHGIAEQTQGGERLAAALADLAALLDEHTRKEPRS